MLFGKSVDDSWSRGLQLWEVGASPVNSRLVGWALTEHFLYRTWPVNRRSHVSAIGDDIYAEQHDTRCSRQPQIDVREVRIR